MKSIEKIRKVSIWIFIIPVVIINAGLLISINAPLLQGTIFQVDAIGVSSFTIPYFDGGTSISRSNRTYPQYLLFKPGMLITAILLTQYWIANNKLVLEINNISTNKKFLFFGVGSAVFLAVHSIFLGLTFEAGIYKFFRRFVLLGFIIFEITAQALLLVSIFKIKDKISVFINTKVLYFKIALVTLLIIVAFVAAPFLSTSEYTHLKHALEWNYFIGVIRSCLLLCFGKRKPLFTHPKMYE